MFVLKCIIKKLGKCSVLTGKCALMNKYINIWCLKAHTTRDFVCCWWSCIFLLPFTVSSWFLIVRDNNCLWCQRLKVKGDRKMRITKANKRLIFNQCFDLKAKTMNGNPYNQWENHFFFVFYFWLNLWKLLLTRANCSNWIMINFANNNHSTLINKIIIIIALNE